MYIINRGNNTKHYNNFTGKLVIAAMNSEDLKNDGTLANVTLKAKAGVSGNSTISVKVDELFNVAMSDITVTTKDFSTLIETSTETTTETATETTTEPTTETTTVYRRSGGGGGSSRKAVITTTTEVTTEATTENSTEDTTEAVGTKGVRVTIGSKRQPHKFCC